MSSDSRADRVEDRKESFKKGIKDKTQKRSEQNTGLRKQKREEKLQRRRIPVKQDERGTFEQLLAQYNAAALLAGNLFHLKLLNQLLGLADKQLMDRYIDTMLFVNGKPAILFALIQTCKSNTVSEVVRLAITCLLNLTGTHASFEIECANEMIKAGYLDIVDTHIKLHLAGNHPTLDTICHASLWETVINIVLACPETRDAVLESKLLGFAGNGDAGINSAFTKDMDVIFNAAKCPEAVRFVMTPVMLAVVCSIYQANADSPPPFTFTLNCWQHVIQSLYDIQPIHHQELDDGQRIRINCVMTILFLVFRKNEDRAAELFRYAGSTMLLQALARIFQYQALYNQTKIVKIFVQIGASTLREGEFQQAMENAGAIPIMMRAIQSNHPEIRQNGFNWIGNFMADGSVHVRKLLDLGVLDSIIPAVKRDVADIRRTAVYALLTMFSACEYDRRTKMDHTEVANGIMSFLVCKQRLFHWLTPFLGEAGQEVVTTDILNVMAAALRWNKSATLEALEVADAPLRLDTILSQVSKFKGSQFAELYNAAVQVDDLMNDRAPEAGRAEIMELDEDFGTVAGLIPGTTIYQGAFKF